jgi:hypothetical protein
LHLGLDCVFAVGKFLFSMQRYPTRKRLYNKIICKSEGNRFDHIKPQLLRSAIESPMSPFHTNIRVHLIRNVHLKVETVA